MKKANLKPKRSTLLVSLSLVVVFLISAGSASAIPPSVWIQNAADRAFYSSPVPANPTTSITLYSARNEYEAAQILVRSSSAQTGVSITAGALTRVGGGGTIPITNIQVNREYNHFAWAVPGDHEVPPDGVTGDVGVQMGNYTDALVENIPVSVDANQTMPYWYSVYVPAGQASGTYRGTVTVNSSLGAVKVPVTIVVYNVTIPPTNQSTFKMNNWSSSVGWDYTGTEQSIEYQYNVTKFSPNWWKVMTNFARNHKKHRNNVIYADFQALLIPNTTISDDGTYTFGWQTFDRFIQLFIDQGAGQYIATPHLLERQSDATMRLEVLKKVNGVTTRTYVVPGSTATDYLHTVFAALKTHLHSKFMPDGVTRWDEVFYMAAVDEPMWDHPNQIVDANWLYAIYKQHFTGNTNKSIEAHNNFVNPEPDLTSVAPQMDRYEEDIARWQNWRISGKELWLYNCILPQGSYMNRFLSFHLNKTRLTPWLAWKVGAVGYLHWGWNFWSDTKDTFLGTGPGFGDAYLVRPNKPAYDVYNSVRSEAQLDGLEDIELLNILKATKPLVAKSIAETLISNSLVYTRSGADVVARHKQILDEIASTQTDTRFPFLDDFSSGNAASWIATRGTWSVADGEYSVSTMAEHNQVAGIKGRSYADLALTFDMRITGVQNGDNTNWAGAVIRSSNVVDMDSGYLIAIRNNGGIFLYRSGATLATSTVQDYVAGQWVKIRVVAQGTNIQVFAGSTPTPLININDSSYTSGNIGVIGGGTSVRFDNVVVNAEQNYAEGRVPVVTSNYTGSGWSPQSGTDGQRYSSEGFSMGWSSDVIPQVSTHSFTIDLGKTYPVSRVDLYPRNDGVNIGSGFPVDFKIQTAINSAGPWKTHATLVDYAQPTNSVQAFPFNSVNARYIRVEATRHRVESPGSTTYKMQFADVQVFGGNLAAGKTVTASSSYEADDWGLSKATDGIRLSTASYSMGWSSNNTPTVQHTEELIVDLGGKSTISQVELFPRNDSGSIGNFFPVNFTIETSPDNVTYTVRSTVTNYPKPTTMASQVNTFTAVPDVRYVKIKSSNGLRSEGTEYRMQIAEIVVK